MHYGREFLSIHMWDSEKAQHLRETCSRVSLRPWIFLHCTIADHHYLLRIHQTLFTWGMGLVAPKLSKAP